MLTDRSKGIALSIRTLVILAIALIVLAALVAIFTGIVPSGSGQMECEAKLRSACLNYTRHGCCADGTNCGTVQFPDCADVTNQEKKEDLCC